MGEPQNLIVLAGINGTGKTTILNALKEERTDYTNFADFIVLQNNYGVVGNSFIRIDFPKNTSFDLNKIYKFSVGEFNHQTIETTIRKYIDHCIFELDIKPFESYNKLRAFFNSILLNFDLGIEFRSLTGEKKALFRSKIDTGYGYGDGSEFGYGNGDGNGNGDGSGVGVAGNKLSFEDLSSGEKQLISLVAQLFVADIKDSIILIDEPEFSLHPSWQNKIVGVLQRYADEYNCQVILATHSPHIIGSVRPEQLRLLYKDESGAIKVKNYVRGSYGWPVDKVLVGLMGMERHLRTPDVARRLSELDEMIQQNKFESEEFKIEMSKLEDEIGADDTDLTIMRFEIAKLIKAREANK